MAVRPLFLPDPHQRPFVITKEIDFEWYPGFAVSQAQKSIRSLHNSAATQGISPVLEISSKSTEPLGIALSAFNLRFEIAPGKVLSVESAFQGSKVFDSGGPFTDLYEKSSREAKTDQRLQASGKLMAFDVMGELFPLQPTTAFYDWLYIRALFANQNLASQLSSYKGFSDIAFNPERSMNCQARSAALFVGLSRKPNIDMNLVVSDKAYYLQVISGNDSGGPRQLSLGFDG